MARGRWVDPAALATTVATVAADWLASNPTKRSSSYARDETIVRVHLLPTLAKRAIGSLSPADAQGLVNAWVRSGAAARTVRRQYGTLRAVCNFAIERDLIVRSPCRGIKLPPVTHARRHVVDDHELEALAGALGDCGLMAYVATIGSHRWGEVAGLRVGDLDLLRQELTVTLAVSRDANGRSKLDQPKTEAGRRTMALPDWLIEDLSAHLAQLGLTAADADAFVFPSPGGRMWSYSNWRERRWNPACVAVGLGRFVGSDDHTAQRRPASTKGKRARVASRRRYEGLTFHDLRRANATALVEAGVDQKTTQTRQGHSDIRLTLELYAQASSAADRAAAEVLGVRFAPRRVRARGVGAGLGVSDASTRRP
jgi:integrase